MRRIRFAKDAHGWRSAALASALLVVFFFVPATSNANTITFDDQGFVHGQVITGVPGVSITTENFNRSFDIGVAFDTERNGTADSDLEAMWRNPWRWSGGNLAGDASSPEDFGKLDLALVIQENQTGCGDGVCNSPDDEGRRAAGTISFAFAVPVYAFGFDLIDIDDAMAENGDITFWNDRLGVSHSVDFKTVLGGFVIGDNSANRIDPFEAAQLGLIHIDRVVFTMGGSGALDNLYYHPVPEPKTALFVGAGLLLMGHARKRR